MTPKHEKPESIRAFPSVPLCWFSPDPCHHGKGPGFCHDEAWRKGWAEEAKAGDGCAYHREAAR